MVRVDMDPPFSRKSARVDSANYFGAGLDGNGRSFEARLGAMQLATETEQGTGTHLGQGED